MNPASAASSSSSHASSSPATATSRPTVKPAQKPVNVFSNDGSFLERFQRTKKEEEEKRKQEDVVAQKRNFDSRFKNRGKRPLPTDSADNEFSSSSTRVDEVSPNKKLKADTESKPLSEYEKQLKSYSGHIIKDSGMGVRPLVK
ncbi:hypothetical protein HGRIS_006410 [Hohenbuehelia grisea]|uniref:Uncharacterized protein n=1 Tax=Hohenbuehelia grisea TaxID=104357 RepID=A0ABR3K2V6_9AGAR